ncbi:MAG: serine/threonine-protein kinase [Planctomycetota bacterium]
MADRLTEVLEACYLALQDGREPDLQRLCADAPELRDRAARILARERHLTGRWRTQEPTPTEPQAGEPQAPAGTIGEFRIIEQIGAGGMGRVYRARQPSLDREVALKVLREEVVDTVAARLRLKREANVTAALDHANIVPVYATGEDRGCAYLAMKLIRGHPLDGQPLPLDPETVARIGAAVAGALHAAHQVGVVHRDVKPANILLEGDRPYVVDFGLARLERPTTALTQGHAAPGTLAYMAPELLRESAPVFDPRVDVYGLGATLYEALRGLPPFRGQDSVRLLRQVLFADPPPLGLGRRHRDLETIVLRALDKVPARRFKTAAEMAAELRRVLAGEPIVSRRVGAVGRAWRRVRRRPAVTAAVAVATSLLIALAVVLVQRHTERTQRFERDVAAVRAALDGGDLRAIHPRMAQLETDFGERPVVIALGQRLDRETNLRSLTLLLQSSVVHRMPQLLEPLVERLDATADPRARLALAFSRGLAAEAPTIALDVELRAAYPRTGAAVEALAEGRSVRDALDGPPGHSGATDRLFAALTLRLQERTGAAQVQELGEAGLDGPERSAIQFSRAVAFEQLGEHRAAYLELDTLRRDPRYAVVACAASARLAASLGTATAARRHLNEAVTALGNRPAAHQRAFVRIAELQLARDLDAGSQTFWQLWEAADASVRDFTPLWLMAGTMAIEDGDLERARDLLQEGMRRDPQARLLSLRSTLLQVEWLSSPWCEEPEPMPDAQREERLRLADLAERAGALASRATAAGRGPIAAEALLTQARCARALGDRSLGWRLLERACAHGTPVALDAFAYLVTYRVLVQHLTEEPDADAVAGGRLGVAARVALERARGLMRRADQGEIAALGVRGTAQSALMACAFHCGDAATTVPLAVQLRSHDATPAPLLLLAERAIEWGGLPLDVMLAADPSLPPPLVAERLQRAIEAVGAFDQLTTDQRRGAARRWSAALAAWGRDDAGPAWRKAMRSLQRLMRR